jgi:hypothetical protein
MGRNASRDDDDDDESRVGGIAFPGGKSRQANGAPMTQSIPRAGGPFAMQQLVPRRVRFGSTHVVSGVRQ